MERDGYRETLAFLSEKAKDKVWLNQTEVSRLLGINIRTVKSRFNVTSDGISIPELAKRMTAIDAKTRRTI